MASAKKQKPFSNSMAASGMDARVVSPQKQLIMFSRTRWEPFGKKLAKSPEKIREEFSLEETWEWQLKRDKEFLFWKKENPIEVVAPLNPQDAFFGGRCNVTKLIYDFGKKERGKYVDFCSLYPSVSFWKDYPVGIPKKIFTPGKYSKKWFGLVKCRNLAPRRLYHPVLPGKIRCGDSDKLVFAL